VEIKRKQSGNGFPLYFLLASTPNFVWRYCVSDWYGSNPRISITPLVAVQINLCIEALLPGYRESKLRVQAG
jgi:hypothetical protein